MYTTFQTKLQTGWHHTVPILGKHTTIACGNTRTNSDRMLLASEVMVLTHIINWTVPRMMKCSNFTVTERSTSNTRPDNKSDTTGMQR